MRVSHMLPIPYSPLFHNPLYVRMSLLNLAGHGLYAIIEDTTNPQPPRDPIFPIKFAKQAMGKIETHNHETGEITATLHTPDNQQLHVTATIDPNHPPQAGGQLPALAIGDTSELAICAYYLGAPVTTEDDLSQHNVLPEQPITTTASWFPTRPHEIYEAGFSATDKEGTNLAFAIIDSIAENVQEHLESGEFRYYVSSLFCTSWCNKYDPAVIAAAENFHTVHSRSGIHDFMRRLNALNLDEFTYYQVIRRHLLRACRTDSTTPPCGKLQATKSARLQAALSGYGK